MEEEDGDSIEKVLWHQPKGTAEAASRNNRSTEPILMNHLFDSEPDWNEMEFLIKWKGQSHLHCQWKSLPDLQNVCSSIPLAMYILYKCETMTFLNFSFLLSIDISHVCIFSSVDIRRC